MKTDKDLLIKGLKFIAYTIALMFSAPIVLYQAFKNEGHPFYWPVLIVGFILAIFAIGMGFYSIKIIMDSLFSKGSKRQ
ncbi:MAG: DUF6095 family protein [Maribacter sp.]